MRVCVISRSQVTKGIPTKGLRPQNQGKASISTGARVPSHWQFATSDPFHEVIGSASAPQTFWAARIKFNPLKGCMHMPLLALKEASNWHAGCPAAISKTDGLSNCHAYYWQGAANSVQLCHENPESVPPIPITALQNLDLCHTGLQSTRCLILGGTGRGLLREQGLLLEQAYVTAGAGLRVRFGAQPV
eukprot:1115712-Pelagomonas_calceolata.AAC.2